MPIVTPEEPSEDTFCVGSFNVTNDTTPISSDSVVPLEEPHFLNEKYDADSWFLYENHDTTLSPYLLDYIELDAFREIPYSINYRRMPPEYQPQSNTRTQGVVGLLTGFVWQVWLP